MNIIALVRTLNEQDNIEAFCRAYAWANHILIADGGSTDDTIKIAESFPNTIIDTFPERIALSDGSFYNPEGKHCQFLFDWASELYPDWLVFDDCDSTPTLSLQRNARTLLETSSFPAASVHRLYLWHDGRYFPRLDVGGSIWAWKPRELNIHAKTDEPLQPALLDLPTEDKCLQLTNPYRLIHHSWRSDEQVKAKMAKYAAQGRPQIYPTESCGPLEELPDWCKSEI